MIEAMAEKAAALGRVSQELGNAEHVIALVGDNQQEDIPFFVVNSPNHVKTGSSKYRENANYPMEQRALPQRTLGQIVGTRGLPFQFLKVDVQGAELDVVRGLGYQLWMIDVILMELSLVQYNAGAPLIAAVIEELSRLGFVLYDLVEEHRYDGHLFQIDALFVRPTSRFRRQPPFWS